MDREPCCSCSGPRGMMVLFLKQVHLQNVGAAGIEVSMEVMGDLT